MAVTKVSLPGAHANSRELLGFGAQLNTFLFTRKGGMTRANDTQDATADQLAQLQTKINGLGRGHCRVFVQRGLNPDTDGRRKLPAWQALVQTVELAQDAGSTVNLTWWGQGSYAVGDRLRNLQWPHPDERNWPNPNLQKWPVALTDPDGPNGVPGPREKMRRFALITHELRKAFPCVTHATIQNEVNGDGRDIAFKGVANLSMRLYERLYRDYDEALRSFRDPQNPSQSLRDAITIVAGDLLQGKTNNDGTLDPNHQDNWIRYLHANMDRPHDGQPSVLDAYSIHVYWTPDQFPEKPEGRLQRLSKLLGELNTDKPVYVTEYGVRHLVNPASARPGTHKPTGLPMEHAPEAAFQHAWFNALAPQERCVGFAKWVMYRLDIVDGWGKWGLIDSPKEGQLKLTPIYHVTKLFNQLLGDNWIADGLARSADKMILVSRFSDPDGPGESVIALNRDDQPRDLNIAGLSLPRYQRADWNRGGHGTTGKQDPVAAAGGTATVKIPTRGAVALSTRPLDPTP